MSIQWHCDCGRKLKAPDGTTGRRARCPGCGQINVVPEPAAAGHVPAPEPAFEPEPSYAPGPPYAQEPTYAGGDAPTDEYGLAEPPPSPARRVPPAAPGAHNVDAPAYAGGSSDDDAVTPAPYRPRPVIVEKADPLPLEGGRTWRDFAYLVLLLAMLPLVFSTFADDRMSILDHIKQTLEHHPEVAERFDAVADRESAELADLIDVFPGHRLDGALLARDSMMHWVFALISAGLFLTLMLFLFRPGHAKPKSLFLTGLFTGTVGIVLLFVVQWLSTLSTGGGVRLPGKVWLLYMLIKLIGLSYTAAEDPTNGIVASFFGFTFGVGLCEELCKALPLLFWVRQNHEKASWRGACLLGLASGVGFGVAEGVMYAGRSYNGILGGDIYLVRFASCVALHAVWSASVAILLYVNRNTVGSAEGFFGVLGYFLVFAGVPMILHGLYDTLLKKDHPTAALAVALGSFVYLAGLIEWGWKRGDAADEPRAAPVRSRAYAGR